MPMIATAKRKMADQTSLRPCTRQRIPRGLVQEKRTQPLATSGLNLEGIRTFAESPNSFSTGATYAHPALDLSLCCLRPFVVAALRALARALSGSPLP